MRASETFRFKVGNETVDNLVMVEPILSSPPAMVLAEHPVWPRAGSAEPAPTTTQIVGKTLLALACSLVSSLAAGAGAGLLAYLAVAGNDDPGSWDALGSFIFGLIAFAGVGTLTYLVVSIVSVNKFVPAGHRTIPALFLTSPIWLAFVAMNIAAL